MNISHFLQAGQTFKTETFKDDPYLLLLVIWYEMIPEDKKKCAYIKGNHNFYSVNVLKELHVECNITYSDI